MKTLFKLTLFVISLGLILTACDGSFDSLVDSQKEANPLPTSQHKSGDADFTKFISIGNSLTAGFMDGALYDNGQMNSIGALIHHKLISVGAQENFNQPDINSVLGFNSAASSAGQILGRFKLNPESGTPTPTINGDPIRPFTGKKRELHNFGVPGVRVGDLNARQIGASDGNPYYNRFAKDPGNSTILKDAIATKPTFFSLWIGNNDVLGFALEGAVEDALPIFTTPTDFEIHFSEVINELMQKTDAKGVVADIPKRLLDVPYFRTVPFNPLPLDSTTVATLNQEYNQYNLLLNFLLNQGQIDEIERDKRRIEFLPPEEGEETRQNAYVMEDPSLKAASLFGQEVPRLRMATERDFTLLPAAQQLGQIVDGDSTLVIGISVPLEPKFILTPDNQQLIKERIKSLNDIIADVITQANLNPDGKRIALYKTNDEDSGFEKLFDEDNLGIQVGGFTLLPNFNPDAILNTVLSMDGIHPNSRGNALIANDFIRAIERGFNATLPKYTDNEILGFPSIQLCSGDCLGEQQMANVEYIWDFSKIPLQ